MSGAIIEVRGLSKRYRLGMAVGGGSVTLRDRLATALRGGGYPAGDDGEFWALRDISFDVSPGDTLGIIGANGAGKSTLLKILSRITEPTEGEITIRGRVASLLEVGTGFHPELSGRENIFLNGVILGMRRQEVEARLGDIIQFSGVERFLDTPIKRYSSGMAVRLAFAVAAHLDPEILIVDEVLAVGDVAFQEKCLGKMEELVGAGRTILFVSHNMSAIESLTQKAILLDRGRVVMAGPTHDAVETYLEAQKSKRDFAESLDSLPRPAWLGKRALHLRNAAISNLEGEYLREMAQLVLRIETIEKIPKLNLVVKVNANDGHPLGTIFAESLTSLRAGSDFEIGFDLPLSALAPGHYSLSIVAITSHNNPADAAMDILPFHFLPKEMPGKLSSAWRSDWGHIYLGSIRVEPNQVPDCSS